MTSQEKKSAVLRQVVKPELKKAGYRSIGQTFYRMEEDCCLAIHIQSSKFSSMTTGYSFRFNIAVLPPDVSQDYLKTGAFIDYINEGILLPDCGYLHPYREAFGYQIDGYQNYKPLDMDVEDIKEKIRDDLCCHILPQLAEIKTLSDWEKKTKEWKQRYNSKWVLLLSFFDMAQNDAVSPNNIPHGCENLRSFGMSAEEVEESYNLYQQVKAISMWPDINKWESTRATLLKII